jgi:predicted RNase H-like HicB family nuclease
VKKPAKPTQTGDTKHVKATHTLTAVIYPGETGRWLVAYNPETGTTTQGRNLAEALKNLKEATALYLEEAPQPVRGRALLTTFDLADA